ncbi:hypothetical protein [Halomicrobium salinisoli]|uniref:hypothetical protein n=1 Tax=Halomicrobium salinisoli TaxID=2878391 RepID=UPI001CF06B6A|nr:hypothetical protein [Halomicrobium salinisoli]
MAGETVFAVFFVLFVVAALAVPLLLWSEIEAETDRTERMDRASAERTARRDAGGDATSRSDDDRRDGTDGRNRGANHWDREENENGDRF